IFLLLAILLLAGVALILWQSNHSRTDVRSAFQEVREQLAAQHAEIEKLKEVVSRTDERGLALVQAADRQAETNMALTKRLDEYAEASRTQTGPLIIQSPLQDLSFSDALLITPM